MRWLIGKAITIPIVLVIVTGILAGLGMSILDDVMKTLIRNEVQRMVLSNPRYAYLPPEEKKEIVKNLTRDLYKAYGLDQPPMVRVLRYIWHLLTFQPIQSRVLATRIINPGSYNAWLVVYERIPFTVILFTTSSILTLAVAIPLGIAAARKPGGILDRVISGWSIFSISMPWWWIGMVMIWIFCYQLRIFAGPGYQTDWTNPLDVAKRAALPVLTITMLSIGVVAYRIRCIVLDILTEDFVLAERAKGVPERTILFRHVLRTAAPPIVTIVLLSIVLSVVSGAILTETVFNWYGLGLLYWDAIQANDIPVVLVLTYISTLLYLLTRFALDILYTFLDPRIRRA